MKKYLLVILIALSLSSCYTSRFHYFGEVPKKPGNYPNFTVKDYLIGNLDESRSCYDVTSYDMDLFLNPSKKIIGGKVKINFKPLRRIVNLRFDLYKNLKIESVAFEGKILKFSRTNRAVFTSFPDSLNVGQDYSIVVTYKGHPQTAKKPPWVGGLVWKKDKEGNPWVGVTCETEGGSIWFPCKDHLSDEPDSVRLTMTVPAGLQVISNGLMEKHISEPGKEIYTWSTHYPINVYNITFYAGEFGHFSDTMNTVQGQLNLDYYVMPENLEKAKQQFKQVKDVINIFSKSFGPYPWIKEGFKLVEAPFEGMEHQTAIAYGSGYSDHKDLGGDYIIVHEAAHEWWGNAVTVSDFSDIWLQEGFATYSEMIFAEKKKGYDSSLLYAKNWLSPMINNKLPVVGPANVNYWDHTDDDVYNKGAMILHTMRNVINDSTLFFDILQTFYKKYAAKSHITTSDFVKLVEQKTGKYWGKFFEAYLYDRKVPLLYWYYGSYVGDSLSVENSDSNPGKPFVIVNWMNVPDGFSMPVIFENEEHNLSETIEVSTKPALHYLKDLASCNSIYPNRKLSYYNELVSIGAVYQFENLELEDK